MPGLDLLGRVVRQDETIGSCLEQYVTHSCFQYSQPPSHGRLGLAQAACGCAKRPRAGDSEKNPEVTIQARIAEQFNADPRPPVSRRT
jgi:hypothetical protein